MKHKIYLTGMGNNLSYPLHSHKEYEILYYLEGHGHLNTSLGKFPFSPGTIIIIPPNVLHGSVSESGFKLIAVDSDFENALSFSTPTVTRDTEARDAEALAKMIYRNRINDDDYLTSLIDAYLRFILRNLEPEDALTRAVRKIVNKISENFFDCHLSTCSLLNESGYAEDYIRAHFKKTIGKTPNDFLTTLRINHALYLIEIYKDTITLSEVSERCGYTDYVYFSKKFKTETGTSPREYKKWCERK